MTSLPADLETVSLQPLLRFCYGCLNLADPDAALEELNSDYPFEGEFVQNLGRALREGVESGAVCNLGEAPVQYSRLFKASEDSAGFSGDAVLMSAPGPLHAHPEGEIDLCFALDGDPEFDGNPPGWVVYPPGSKHVPTVTGGTMLILYLLPGGAIEFLKS